MELPRLSASKLRTYSTCPRRYWYDYVQKIESPKNAHAALGSAVHKAIERVYTDGVQPVQAFASAFESQLKAYDLPLDPKLYLEGVKIVDAYDFSKRIPREVEHEFMLPFPNAAHPICQIHGFLDQLYDWGFVDLKTNKRKPLRGVLDHDLQFIIYAWAFKEIHGYDPSQSIWHHLRTQEDLEADVVGKVDIARYIVEKILDSEETGIYDRHIGDACLFCSHKEVCLGRAD